MGPSEDEERPVARGVFERPLTRDEIEALHCLSDQQVDKISESHLFQPNQGPPDVRHCYVKSFSRQSVQIELYTDRMKVAYRAETRHPGRSEWTRAQAIEDAESLMHRIRREGSNSDGTNPVASNSGGDQPPGPEVA